MAKATKRIHKVTIKRMVDESPDTSWLGEYSNKQKSEYSIDRAHSLDCPINTGRITGACPSCGVAYPDADWTTNVECSACHDAVLEPETECDCGEYGDMRRNEYQYFNPSFNYVDKTGKAIDTPENVRKYTCQDYERMESLNRGDWCFIGIRADAEIQAAATWENSVVSKASWHSPVAPYQTITSGGLWGLESDTDSANLELIEQEQLSELRDQLHALGFSKRAIAAAFKDVERGN